MIFISKEKTLDSISGQYEKICLNGSSMYKDKEGIMMGLTLKLAGMVFVVGSSLCYARECSNALELRMIQLRQLYSILIQLKSELKYMNSTLPECFHNLSCHIEEPFAKWMNQLALSMENERNKSFDVIWSEKLGCLYEDSVLEDKDIELLKELKDKLGTADADAGIKAIDYVLVRLEENRDFLKNEMRGKQKVTLSISLFAGFMVVILLM